MADHSSTRSHNIHITTPTPAPSNHHHTKNNKKYYSNNNQHASSTAAIITNPSTASRSHSSAGMTSNIIPLPSNVPVMTDPYFDKPSPINIATPSNTEASHSTINNVSSSTTPTVGSPNRQQQQQQQIAGPLVGAILGSVGLIGIIVAMLVCIKRQKKNKRRQDCHIYSNNSRAGAMINNQQQQQQQKKGQRYTTIKREESNHSDSPTLQPPSASYTPHCQKRLTTDTLVDQRASMSTMNSTYSSRNHQYKPQLAYKQQLHTDCDVNTGQDDYYHLDGLSPSNTLIDTTVITMAITDDEKAVENNNSRRQRVPSYQPQIVAMTDDETINNSSNNKHHVPAGQQEQHATNNNDKDNYNGIYANDVRGVIPSNYYDYLYQSNYSGGEGQGQQQQHVNHHQQENDHH